MWRHAASGFPGQDQGCQTCSFLADGIGHQSHLYAAGTTLALVSRAPYPSIQRFGQRMGWTLPWYSSLGSEFNYDSHVSFDEDKTPSSTTTRDKATLERDAPHIQPGRDAHGVSVFLRNGDRILHTYSAYARGVDPLLSAYQWLDLTPLGSRRHVTQFPYHDQYPEET
jgi:predicted dithiol-disulfide oxidoreductase (DUF899 family)